MNRKNILISIGIIGAGLILYKLLFGFVLPIALFVALGYILKFLLKGADSVSVQEASQILTKSEPPSSIENIVEIKPIEEVKTTKEDQPTEEINPIEEVKTTKEDQPTEEINPIEDDKTSKEDQPTEGINPIEEVKTTKEDQPTEEIKSTEGDRPIEEDKPFDE